MQNQETEQLKEQYYREDLEKIDRNDLKKSWVSSSPYIFYLSVACIVLMTWGGCYKLYTKRFEKPQVSVQESTLYKPVYK